MLQILHYRAEMSTFFHQASKVLTVFTFHKLCDHICGAQGQF